MKNFSRILALVLALMMIISVVVVVPASAEDAKVTYKDEAVERLWRLDIFKGKDENTFVPAADENVTREQMAMFVARLLTGWTDNSAWEAFENDTPFIDIADRPAVNVGGITYAYQHDIIVGKPGNRFDPKGNVSYRDAIVMIVRSLLGVEETANLSYPAGYINMALSLGLTDGISGIAYTDLAPRGVVATLMYNALDAANNLVGTAFNAFPYAAAYQLVTDRYMLIGTNEAMFDGASAMPVDADYLVFAPLNDNVTVNYAAAIVILAEELAGEYDLNTTDFTAKLGYVYDLTFTVDNAYDPDDYDFEKFAWADEYVGDKFVDYGLNSNQIGVNGAYLTVNGQSYDINVTSVEAESTNPAKVFDLMLYEFNTSVTGATVTGNVAFVQKTSNAGVGANLFQEVTLYDTNNDGMYDYGMYAPYYIGNRITSGIYFQMPGSGPFDFQVGGYFQASAKTPFDVTADWDFVGKASTYNTVYVYTVNPAAKIITVVESADRSDANRIGEVKIVNNNAITKRIIDATVTIKGEDKVFENINVLDNTQFIGVEELINFEWVERMPDALEAIQGTSKNWHQVFEQDLLSDAYNKMHVLSIGGYTIVAWPELVKNYTFVAFDFTETTFAMEDNILVVKDALTDATGAYTSVKISTIYNEHTLAGSIGDGVHTFDGMEFLSFCDAVDMLYTNPTVLQYNMYQNDVRRAAIMATPEYQAALRLNIMQELNGEATPASDMTQFYAVTGADANGNLILEDVDSNNIAVLSPATNLTNYGLTTKDGTITFYNGVADNAFVTDSRNTSVVSKAANLVVTDETVFTFVANDGIFTYTGKPANADSIVLDGFVDANRDGIDDTLPGNRNSLIIAANAKQIMIVDRDRSIEDITLGTVNIAGKKLNETNTWVNHTFEDVWEFDQNPANYCPQGFKWNVDAAYLVTNETRLETIWLEGGIALYKYTNLYNMITCQYEAKTWTRQIALVVGTVVVDDRADGLVDSLALENIFVDTDVQPGEPLYLNSANWTIDTYVGKLVSGGTVGYYEFTDFGKLYGIEPNVVVINRDLVNGTASVQNGASALKEGARVYFTFVNGVPTGYAIQF